MEIDTICMGSGGVQGLMYISGLKYLINNNFINLDKIKNYYGTSVGSIVAFLFAIGYTPDELIDLILNLENIFFEPEIDLMLIENEYGLDNGNLIINNLKELLKRKHTVEDITFIELYKLTNKLFVTNAINLHTGNEKIFNYLETPDMSVFLAIRMSISIPLLYTPVKYNNEYYADGALKNKLLLKYCNIETTLSFRMKNCNYNEINSIQTCIFASLYILLNNTYFDNQVYKIVDFECVDNQLIKFNITKDYLKNLFNMGEYCSKKFYLKELKKKIKLLKIDIENNPKKKIKDIMDKVILDIKLKK
jgi:hypothetical protein